MSEGRPIPILVTGGAGYIGAHAYKALAPRSFLVSRPQCAHFYGTGALSGLDSIAATAWARRRRNAR